MTGRISVSIDAAGLSESIGAAGAEITRVAREEIAPAAALIEDAFAAVARGIERDLARAARAGELSLKGLARSILNDLKRVAIDALVRKPIESLLAGLFSAPFGGGRAGGGFVARGQSYLVGERGPELFTPSVSGRVGAGARSGVTVNITLPGVADPASFRQSETQIAAAMARALSKAERNG
jgi:phage-related minor tail protein